jgi:hypothetical protein
MKKECLFDIKELMRFKKAAIPQTQYFSSNNYLIFFVFRVHGLAVAALHVRVVDDLRGCDRHPAATRRRPVNTTRDVRAARDVGTGRTSAASSRRVVDV